MPPADDLRAAYEALVRLGKARAAYDRTRAPAEARMSDEARWAAMRLADRLAAREEPDASERCSACRGHGRFASRIGPFTCQRCCGTGRAGKGEG